MIESSFTIKPVQQFFFNHSRQSTKFLILQSFLYKEAECIQKMLSYFFENPVHFFQNHSLFILNFSKKGLLPIELETLDIK